jgi:hypothetical protein
MYGSKRSMIGRILIGILAASNLALAAADEAPFPPVSDLNSVQFSLERSYSIFGSASYKLQINGNGLVTFEGFNNVAVLGKHTGRVSKETVQKLLDAFQRAHFYSLANEYVNPTLYDAPSRILSLKIGANSKTVVDKAGQSVGMPTTAIALEAAMDAAADSATWVRGNRATVPALRAEGFDFHSEAAGLILTHTAASGVDDVVADLIRAGAPANTVDADPHSDGRTALHSFVVKGDLRMVRELIKAGAHLNDRDRAGMTPLLLAQSPDVAQALLDAGADLDLARGDGKTALELARQNDNAALTAVLQRATDASARRLWQTKDLTSVQFSLQRYGCYGKCPTYQLTITGDGAVSWNGEMNVAAKGKRTSHVSAETVQKLLQTFQKADFFSFQDNYMSAISDYPTCKMSLTIGKTSKTIVDYDGTRVGMPQVITDLENALDAAAGAKKWIKGKP